ncbi:MAG: sortase [Candidatus Berkelbacteria bacterium]|nr:sortase [Candidatus Berkelbacteria bacterium]MCR4307245.1 sortase [Candidatus Berkelbacteria bacterium]
MPLKPVTFNESDLKKIFRQNTPMVRFWRAVRRVLKATIWFVVVFGFFFAAMNAPAYWQRASYASRDSSTVQPPPTPPPAPVVNYDPEIIIAKTGTRAPVIYDARFDEIIERLRVGVVRYEGTADPGQVGNVVIVGHSSDFPWSTGQYKTIFALLDKLVIGDEIVLPFGQNRYTYKVRETKIVKPTDLTVLARTATPTLTLISCYPLGTALNRIIIIASLADGPIGPVQTTEPFLGEKLTTAR